MKFVSKLFRKLIYPSDGGNNGQRSDGENDKPGNVANAIEGVEDPPPAYNYRDFQPKSSSSSKHEGLVASTPKDPYAFLSFFDTIFLIDDSSSMKGASWHEVRLALKAIVPKCVAHDADGIDLYFLNYQTKDEGNADQGKASGGFRNIKMSENVGKTFSTVGPRGATFTGQRLRHILKPYLELLEQNKDDIDTVKALNIIVITDGAANDDVEAPIITAAKELDKLGAPMHQLGIQFFQVGNDCGAREALRELDDSLGQDLRDIVDTVTWNEGQPGKLTADHILKVLLGAVVKRLDRKPARGRGSK
ncbi:hypothetical protein COL154_013604 [Colletotrichum chrysophilum]|nr:hypothetical protein KNSL1_013584 [Colletotrichum chrysophilum]KAJ0349361.1 hypothetical protein COL154_013604 [Colletotrichum chrysophilum]